MATRMCTTSGHRRSIDWSDISRLSVCFGEKANYRVFQHTRGRRRFGARDTHRERYAVHRPGVLDEAKNDLLLPEGRAIGIDDKLGKPQLELALSIGGRMDGEPGRLLLDLG